jgi:hypothetical protein
MTSVWFDFTKVYVICEKEFLAIQDWRAVTPNIDSASGLTRVILHHGVCFHIVLKIRAVLLIRIRFDYLDNLRTRDMKHKRQLKLVYRG